jgi:hypothetical protein
MATASRYIQLSSSVLMEYIYADQSVINVPGNQFRINTNTAPIWEMYNLHTKVPQILNADSSEIIQDGLPIGTGNVRNRSFADIEPYRGALLDIDKITVYNDYDTKLTPTANLPVVFTNPQAPVYDTIRLHLVQGFNFEDHDGLILNVTANKKTSGQIALLNWIYQKSDTWEVLNPSPFFFGGRVYASYIEVRVLSLYNLIYDYWLGTLTGDTVVERITNFDGLQYNQSIQVNFAWLKEKATIDDQTYITFYDGKSVDLPTRDQFETISAVIQESNNGDYIEFYAAYSGNIIENYITDLNNSGGDYMLLHDLNVFEYVNDGTGNFNWILTDTLQISQTTDYDLPNTYRPIIKNSSAISYKIDYVVRLYNRIDNTQVWKTSSLISQNAAKYGRKLLSINLGTNPIQSKIYNQNVIKNINIQKVVDPVLSNTKYITSFIDSNAVSVSFQTVNPDTVANSSLAQGNEKLIQSNTGSNLQVFDNGLGRIVIPNGTGYLKFTLYQKSNNINSPLNVSGLGNFILSFTTNTGESLDIIEFPNQFTSPASGEIAFKIFANQAKDILGFTNKSFNILLENDKGEQTLLYSGKFYSIEDYQNLAEIDKVTNYQKQIQDLNELLNASRSQANAQQNTITNLLAKNKALASDDATDNAKIVSLTQIIDDLNQQVANLNKELATTLAAMQISNGLPVTPTTTELVQQSETLSTVTVATSTATSPTSNVSSSNSSKLGSKQSQSAQEKSISKLSSDVKTTKSSTFSVGVTSTNNSTGTITRS